MKGIKLHKSSTGNPQGGFASFMITLITMMVITLIVIGFAAVSRREQRQQLDQLQSSQAFYAAESAVEDAKYAIRQFQATNPGVDIPVKDKCTANNPGVSIYPTGTQMIVSNTTQSSYTCLKVNPAPGSLQYQDVGNDSLAVPITTSTPFTQLRITWRPIGASGNPNAQCPNTPTANNREFTAAGSWTCQYGVIRTDVVPTNSGGLISNLSSKTLSGFLVPVKTGGGGNFDYSGNTGTSNIVPADCDKATYTSCQVTIDNIPATTSASARISSIYHTSNVTIDAFDATGAPVKFEGAQISIDATGKSTDVLRRIQVRIPATTGSVAMPNYALATSGSICKRFSASAGYFNIPGDIIDPDSAPSTGNEMCAPRLDGAGPGATGDAGLAEDPCVALGNCPVGFPPSGNYYYYAEWTNDSNNPPSEVLGCRWDWGDGTHDDNVSCNKGEKRGHDYPTLVSPRPYPQDCNLINYTMTLTVNVRNVSPSPQTQFTLSRPNCL